MQAGHQEQPKLYRKGVCFLQTKGLLPGEGNRMLLLFSCDLLPSFQELFCWGTAGGDGEAAFCGCLSSASPGTFNCYLHCRTQDWGVPLSENTVIEHLRSHSPTSTTHEPLHQDTCHRRQRLARESMKTRIPESRTYLHAILDSGKSLEVC